MKPFITPFGIVLLVPFYWLCFLGIRKLWRRLSPSPKRWGLLLLAPPLLVLPYADEFWVAWHFERACREAGVTVYRKVEAEGYLNATTTGWSKPALITIPEMINDYERAQFRFQERLTSRGKISHAERLDGQWQVVILDKPQARYHYRYADPRQWVPAGYQMNRREMQVIDSETGEVLGREVWFERYPGFVEGLWLRFLGSGQTICYGESEKRQTLYESVLIPKKTH